MRHAKVTIITPVESEELSPAERWDVVFSAALALRVAVEQYIPEAQRDAALIAIDRIIRSDAPADLKFEDGLIDDNA